MYSIRQQLLDCLAVFSFPGDMDRSFYVLGVVVQRRGLLGLELVEGGESGGPELFEVGPFPMRQPVLYGAHEGLGCSLPRMDRYRVQHSGREE